MGLMFRVAVLRACRRAELCGFRWADSDLEKPYRDPADRRGAHGRGAWPWSGPSSNSAGSCASRRPRRRAGKRRVFLDHETAELLREHRKAQLRLRLKAGEAWQDNDLVFCQDDGQPVEPGPRVQAVQEAGRAGGRAA